MNNQDIKNILTGKTPPSESINKDIRKLSLADITIILEDGKYEFRNFFSMREEEFYMLFFRLRKLIPNYIEFSKFINAHVLPTLEFYEFASKHIIFYEAKSKPLIFFSHITKDTWNERLYDADFPEVSFLHIRANIYKMLKAINPNYSLKELTDLCHDMFTRIYNSKLRYFDGPGATEYIQGFNLAKKDLSAKEISAYNPALELVCAGDLAMSFFELNDEEEKPVKQKGTFKVLDNFIAIAGNSLTKICKFILSVTSFAKPESEIYTSYLIRGYEKTGERQFPFKKYDENNHLDPIETAKTIYEYYIESLIGGRLSKQDTKIIIQDLLSAEYEIEELDNLIERVEKKIFTNHDEFLLLYYQALLTKKICHDKNIFLEEVRYNPLMQEDGRYEHEYKTVTYYPFQYDMDNPEEMVPIAIEVVNHEMRHAFQDNHMHQKISLPSLLSDLESMICDKPVDDKTVEEEYEERYDQNYFENDAKVYSFYATYKKLRELSSASAERYFVESASDDPVISRAAKSYLDSVRKRLSNASSDMKSVERFFFLLTETYKRIDLQTLAQYREYSASLKAITREDGSLLALSEIRRLIDTCDNPHLRYFYINYARKYEACIGLNDIFQNEKGINR